MTPQRYQQVIAVFDKAVHCEPDRRDAVLNQACAGDPDLKTAVKRMLAADAEAIRDSFLDVPTDVVVQTRPITERPGDRVGPYKILQPLGEGGMGAVFLAEQGEPVRRRVALKLIKPGMDSAQVIARFAAERQALAILDHPNIAKVLDAGTSDRGRPYFVMDLVKGLPITEYCDHNKLTPRQRLELFIPVCRAIQHAHQKGIIHRDIKPSNVLVTLVDGKPVAKVIDFGVAKAVDQRLTEQTIFTQMGAAVGTLEYMSPEQADLSAMDVDTRSDVYSLGVLLYELLTGTTPLDRAKLRHAGYAEIVRQIQEEEPAKPSTRLASSGERLASIAACRGEEPARLSKLVRGELDWIAMKALEKDRTRRYETVSSLARDVERYLEGDAVDAGPPSPGYKLSKFARRHRAAIVTGASLFLLVIGSMAAAVCTYLAIRARQAEALTSQALRETTEAKAQTEIALTKTHQALQAADDSRREAQAVSSFLIEAFRKPDPTQDGRMLRVVDLLDQAAASLDARFAGSPTTKSALLNALGETYLGLGLANQAVQLLEQAADLREAALGIRHLDTLQSRRKLSEAYLMTGLVDKSISLAEQTLKLTEASLGTNHPHTLRSRNNLAAAYQTAGRIQDAIAIYEQSTKLMAATVGPDHPDTLNGRQNLALAYLTVGRIDQSIHLAEHTLRLMEARLGSAHPHTLAIRNTLAWAYREVGRLGDAIKMLENVVEFRTKALGPSHPDTLASRASLASIYFDVGRRDDAIALFKETLKLREAVLGREHPATLENLASLAIAYQSAGNEAKAEPLLHDLLQRLERNGGTADLRLERPLANLGLSYLELGKFGQAESILRRCLAIRQKANPDEWKTFNAMSLLGASLLGLNRYAEAEPLLSGGYAGMKHHEASIPERSKIQIEEAAKRIVALYDAWGKPTEAAAWRAKLKLPPTQLPAGVFAPPG